MAARRVAIETRTEADDFANLPYETAGTRYSHPVGDGRHRADPKGHSHYLVGALGVFLLAGLVAGGGYTLHGALTTSPEPPPAAVMTDDPPSSEPSVFAAASPKQRASRNDDSPPTLAVRVVGERCYVNVTTADGKTLVDRTLTSGEQFVTDRSNLQVTIGDSGAAEILVNGEERERGERGELETFTVGNDS